MTVPHDLRKRRPIPRGKWIQILRATCPQLRVTQAYVRLLAQRGGSRGAYPQGIGIMAGGEVHLCVVADRKVRGNQRDA